MIKFEVTFEEREGGLAVGRRSAPALGSPAEAAAANHFVQLFDEMAARIAAGHNNVRSVRRTPVDAVASIHAEFTDYVRHVYDGPLTLTQRTEIERAFFAGAWTSFTLVQAISTDAPEAEATARVEVLVQEMRHFFAAQKTSINKPEEP